MRSFGKHIVPTFVRKALLMILALTCLNGFHPGYQAHAQIGNFQAIQLFNFNDLTQIEMTSALGSFYLRNDGDLFYLGHDITGGLPVVQVEPFTRPQTLNLSQGGVGIGVTAPQEMLHLKAGDDQPFDRAMMLIETDSVSQAVRTGIEMFNNGGSRMLFSNSESGEAWAMLTNNADNFFISRGGTGGAELMIRKDGAVYMGPGTETNFLLFPNGNLRINGTLLEQSDRNSKTRFRTVDSQEILDRVTRLPLTTWQYKDDDPGVRHLGPMAQDFRQAFGLGMDDTSIASVDTAGVSLAAIQGLNQKLDAQVRDLKSSLEEKTQQLESLQQSQAELESRLLALEAQLPQ